MALAGQGRDPLEAAARSPVGLLPQAGVSSQTFTVKKFFLKAASRSCWQQVFRHLAGKTSCRRCVGLGGKEVLSHF